MATTSSLSTPKLNLSSTMGALYLGLIGSAMLYGVTNMQIYFYVRKYQQDRMMLKCVVALLWGLDTLHTAFITAEIWHYLISSFGNNQALLPVSWSHKAQQLISVIIILVIRNLYAWRVWRLSIHQSWGWIWPWIIGIFLSCGYAASIIIAVETYKLHSWEDYNGIRWGIIFAYATSALNDVVFAAGICHLLFLLTPTAGAHRGTRLMMWTIMRYVLISGTLTSMVSLAGLGSFFITPTNFIPLALQFMGTKLTINSYLAMLNARESIRDRGSLKMEQMYSLEIRFSTEHDVQGGNGASPEVRTENSGQSSPGEDQTATAKTPPEVSEDVC